MLCAAHTPGSAQLVEGPLAAQVHQAAHRAAPGQRHALQPFQTAQTAPSLLPSVVPVASGAQTAGRPPNKR